VDKIKMITKSDLLLIFNLMNFAFKVRVT